MAPTKAKTTAKRASSKSVAEDIAAVHARVDNIVEIFTNALDKLGGKLDDLNERLHAVVESGAIAQLGSKLHQLELNINACLKCKFNDFRSGEFEEHIGEIHAIKLEVARIDQKVTGVLWVMGVTIGPAVAYLVTLWLMKLIGGV
jgi:hypothetical protein